jgi:hypothetical protein
MARTGRARADLDGGLCPTYALLALTALQEIGVKIKLLDLTGERVEIPSSVPVLGVPTSESFYYNL